MHHRFRVEPLRSCEPAARPRALVTSLCRSGTSSRVRPTVAIVDNIVATTFSLAQVIATTSPEHTLTVRPGLTTLPRATIRSPCAGERKFTLYSIVNTDAPDGISVIAA